MDTPGHHNMTELVWFKAALVMPMISMIFVILIMNNSNLRTLPPSLVGRNNDIGCDIDVLDIYDRCEIDQDKS